jgi:hypothetical protein
MNNTVEEHGEYNLIWVSIATDGEYILSNPKNLQCMNLSKAIGSLIWTRKILGKSKLCFVYDPSVITVFNEDGTVWKEMVDDLVKQSENLK